MLYREIIAVCSQIHTKHINTLCGQNVEFVNVKRGDIYSNYWICRVSVVFAVIYLEAWGEYQLPCCRMTGLPAIKSSKETFFDRWGSFRTLWMIFIHWFFNADFISSVQWKEVFQGCNSTRSARWIFPTHRSSLGKGFTREKTLHHSTGKCLNSSSSLEKAVENLTA